MIGQRDASITMLQVQEVAELLKVSVKTVRRWIDSGELAAFRIGRGVRVSHAELARFITSHRSTPTLISGK